MLAFDILSKAPFSPQVFQSINQTFIEAALRMAAGQDLDLAGETKTIEDYWLTIEMKTGAGYAAACAAGAMVGTDNPKLIQACGTFGHHLGLAIQIFNDMDSIWDPNGITDLKQGKVTLPLIYGLTTNHPDRDELKSLVKSNEVAAHGERIKEILDRIDTRAFLIWAALKEQDQALEAISICPNAEGKEVLESYITGMFGDIDSLLQEAEADNYYKSPALQLRNQLRT
jgi:geranylgeranyl diphosphate synthase type I